jgi:pyruvate kinase
MASLRRTKIVATVGPASATAEALSALIAAGVDVFRLNFSHGTHESHHRTYHLIREAAEASGHIVAVMQDLSGPKIRTGAIEGGGPLMLEDGSELVLQAGEAVGRPGRISTPYAQLIESARPGDRLLLDDGRIELRVVSNTPSELTTVVVNGGPLGQKKGINAPGVALPSSAVTDKDALDLRFGVELGIDYAALSFVQTADDVRRAQEVMADGRRQVPLIAKIERPAAVRNVSAILAVAQGVMVARGDLGLEMPLEQVPRVQKEIIRRARQTGRPAIVATQVLESMRSEPRPTRAEVSDAANAVGEGADAIMLAGETAVGAYPVKAVETLDRVIREAETMPIELAVPAVDPTGSRHGRALCEAAVTLAATAQADAIVAVTREGKTVRMLASLRPTTPVFATTPTDEIARRLSLLWGVAPLVTPERSVDTLQKILIDRRTLQAGATVVFVSVGPELNRSDVNFLNVQQIR